VSLVVGIIDEDNALRERHKSALMANRRQHYVLTITAALRLIQSN